MSHPDLSPADLEAFRQTLVDLETHETRAPVLVAIERALARIDVGMYGLCAQCGGPITRGRLEARPAAPRCIACERASESEGGIGGELLALLTFAIEVALPSMCDESPMLFGLVESSEGRKLVRFAGPSAVAAYQQFTRTPDANAQRWVAATRSSVAGVPVIAMLAAEPARESRVFGFLQRIEYRGGAAVAIDGISPTGPYTGG